MPIPGVAGSTFRTQINIYATVPCTFYPASSSGGFATVPPWPSSEFCCLADGSTAVAQPRFVFVDPQCADSAKLILTVQSPGGPVQMPVIREDQFLSDTSQFLGIPILLNGGECTFSCEPVVPVDRHRVRVINSASDPNGEVLVNLWLPWGSLPRFPDAQYRVHLDQHDGDDASFPYYGQVDVDNPCLRQSPHGCVSWIGRIEVVPVSAGLRYWAFVSSTDNSTQQVQVSLPQ